jgi:hypothetical protein
MKVSLTGLNIGKSVNLWGEGEEATAKIIHLEEEKKPTRCIQNQIEKCK